MTDEPKAWAAHAIQSGTNYRMGTTGRTPDEARQKLYRSAFTPYHDTIHVYPIPEDQLGSAAND